ncbi:MAG: phytanoyl-CoA dioxygenase family protein [Candidatus Latescibacterota bacterium]|nr:phytanoyl-CoA dioxygenase family protein [Candidatus Latescibacterota bacterium]
MATYRAPAFADAKPEHVAPGCTPERLSHLEEHGFVIIDDFVDSPWIPTLRAAGRRVTEACVPEKGYSVIDCSKGYVHRTGDQEPWAIRGLIHPDFGEPSFAQFHGSDEFLGFVASWCDGLKPEELTLSGMLLWCNPRQKENVLGWHRDVTWWGTGKPYFAQEQRTDGPALYAEEVERARWAEIQEKNATALAERNGVSMFLALTDDECHELIPGSHNRWRTPLEHDVLLPKAMKEQGVPHTPSWNGEDPLPGQVAIRLKAGEALIRNGATIHTGHTVPDRERNTLSIGWSKWSGSPEEEPIVADARHAWQLDPAVCEALPEFMKTAWDRWAETQRLGDTLEDRYAGFDIERIKAGEVVGWCGELERAAAVAGDTWKPYQKLT